MPNVQRIACSDGNFTYGRSGGVIDHIVIHYTGTDASAYNNGIYFSRPGAGASAHYFVDGSGTIIHSVGEGDAAWHAGDWGMNCRSIGIEVVSAGWDFTEAEISELNWLVGILMANYGISADRVIRHYDVTGKHCPAPYVDNNKWYVLRERITKKMSTDKWPLQLYTVNGTAAQGFIPKWNSDGTVSFINAANGLYLDVTGASKANGAILGLHKGNGTAAQKFKLKKADVKYNPKDNQPYLITPIVNEALCIDCKWGGTGNGVQLHTWPINTKGSKAQYWYLVDRGDGTVCFVNPQSMKAIDAVGGGR